MSLVLRPSVVIWSYAGRFPESPMQPSLPGLRHTGVIIVIIPLLLCAAAVGAQESKPDSTNHSGDSGVTAPRQAVSVPHQDAPTARAVRTPEPISVDGRLEESVWMTAPAVTEFWQMMPNEGAPASRPTEVRFLYDDEAIYVGAWLWDERGRNLPARFYRRDVPFMDTDVLSIHFDSYHDHRTSYRVVMNPSGAKRDVILIAGRGGGLAGLAGGDVSWDPVWEGKTTITDEGWFAEIRIPFSQLRFRRDAEHIWGLQIERKTRADSEDAQWVYTPSTEVGSVPRFGHLTGIRGIRSGRKLELLPYVGGRAEYIAVPRNEDVLFDDPFRSGADYFGYGGLDVKYLLTPNLTVDATVNPDFGQVEVDPAVINLTAFETRFTERRPFFVEGADNFEFGDEEDAEILYTRRIGRPPRGETPKEAIYALTPPATTILGAAKLTGKTSNGWSLAVLNAVTGQEQASWIDSDGIEHEQEVEPLTNYFASRARRELRDGQTTFGGLITAVHRGLDRSPSKRTLHAAAYAGGVDFKHEWANRKWALTGQFSPSWVSGSTAVLVATQRTSARYYQRPDADYLEVDSAATSLFGYSARAALRKQTGGVRLDASVFAISPGYEVNDWGFQTIADRTGSALAVGYEQTRPSGWFQSWSLRAGPNLVWNYGGDRVESEISIGGDLQFLNFSSIRGRFAYSPPKLNGRLTRGGPLTRDPAAYSGSVSYGTNRRSASTGTVGLNFTGDRSGAWERKVELGVGLAVSEMLHVSLSPTLTRTRATAQYVASVPDPLASRTFGRRYIFADLRQSTFSLDARINVALNPEMSFELFAQPFISTGDYEDLKELAAPRSFQFMRYGSEVGTLTPTADERHFRIGPDAAGPAAQFTAPNRDFSYRSLRANAVFRWEWRPGSTLYLVWQQQRLHELDAFDVGPLRQAGQTPGRARHARYLQSAPRQRVSRQSELLDQSLSRSTVKP